jgi:hypothetical protein
MQNTKQFSALKFLKTGFLISSAVIVLFSCSKSEVAEPEAPVTTNALTARAQVTHNVEQIPFEETLFVPCANGGAGEDVTLTGKITVMEQVVFTGNGFTLVYQVSTDGVSGTGLTTGDKYVASGGTEHSVHGAFFDNSQQFTGTTLEQMRLIGRGQAANAIVRYKFHYTVTPSGTVTSSTSEETVTCH